jgi:acetyltransferase-like isoleucine patch superfamily enzyme
MGLREWLGFRLMKILEPNIQGYLDNLIKAEIGSDHQSSRVKQAFDNLLDQRLQNDLLTVGSGSQLEAYLRIFLTYQHLIHGDPSRLNIAPTALVNNALFNVSSGRIVIEDNAFFGHNVCVLTGTHDFHSFGAERQNAIPRSGYDIRICQGVWISSNVTVIGPCVIGENSVVAAGSLVNSDVPPYTIVAGLPARPIKQIEH